MFRCNAFDIAVIVWYAYRWSNFLGDEAKRVFNDAQTLLRNIQNDGSLELRGTVGFYRAQAVGDDIEVLDEDGIVLETLHGIRQQVNTLMKDCESFKRYFSSF